MNRLPSGPPPTAGCHNPVIYAQIILDLKRWQKFQQALFKASGELLSAHESQIVLDLIAKADVSGRLASYGIEEQQAQTLAWLILIGSTACFGALHTFRACRRSRRRHPR